MQSYFCMNKYKDDKRKRFVIELTKVSSPASALLHEICNKGLKAYLLPDTEGGNSQNSKDM